MEIKFKNTPAQVELIKAMGSKNAQTSREALQAFADFIGPVIKQVLNTAGSAARIYKDVEYDEDSDPSIPLDLFYSELAGYVTVWSQSVAGGLGTSQVEGIKELKFGTYRLDSAISWNKKYARKNRLDVISKSIERFTNEVLVKQERNAWIVVLKALAEASTKTVNKIPDSTTNPAKHAVASATANVFVLKDLSNLILRMKRINESYSGNTPSTTYTNGPTDLFVSPEIKAQIRNFAFNPIDTSASNVIQSLTDDLKNQIWSQGGLQSIMGITLNEMIEFGDNQKYNVLFDSFTAGQSFPGSNGGAWQLADQILVGVDNTRGALLRPIERNADDGGTFNVQPDGQWDAYGTRVEKQGLYGHETEGRMCIDARALSAVAV